MTDQDKLYLIDASSMVHRAFHALPGLSAKSGFPTGAVFGFLRLLLKVLKDAQARLTAVVFDAKGPTFRHQMDPNYKAHRPPMDPELGRQIPVIKELVAALGLKQVEREGVEADDVIATLARLAREEGREAVIVSGDKDLMQCLGPGVTMWDTMKDRVFDPEAVQERFGVGPDRLPDVFGLIGDATDNIPGVPGIGPKTAGQLIDQYGDLESLLEKAGEIKQPKRRESLMRHAQAARLSKRLFTLEDRLDLGLELAGLTIGPRDEARLAGLLSDLDMNTLKAELGLGRMDAQSQAALPSVKTVDSAEDLQPFLDRARQAGHLALAARLRGNRPLWDDLLGLGLAAGDEAVEIPAELAGSPALKALLAEAGVAKVGFNLKAAWLALKTLGLDLDGLAFDPLVADYLLAPGRRADDPAGLVKEHLGLSADLTRPGLEAALALRLKQALEPKLKDAQVDGVLADIEMPLVPVLAGMEWAGVALDPEELSRLSATLGARLESLQKDIAALAGESLNPNSPQQLGHVLFEKLGLPQGKKTRKKTGFSTDVEVLEELKDLHPLPGLVLDFRQLTKLKSTYVDPLSGLIHPRTGRVHTTFNQTVTATGRLSSSDPNLQNIPIRGEGGEIRRAFVAAPDHVLISADYSQIELRMLAHFTEDPALIQAFIRDEDIHTQTAVEVFGVMPGLVDPELRRRAKVINFGLIYGMTAFGLARDLKTTPKMADQFIKTYFKRFAGVKRFYEEALDQARRDGFVTTLWGRRRLIPDLKSPDRMKRTFAERTAINTLFQGSSADLIKRAMIRLDALLKEKNLPGRLILQVHDELVLEVQTEAAGQAAALTRSVMEKADDGRLRVPLKVGLAQGANWEEAH